MKEADNRETATISANLLSHFNDVSTLPSSSSGVQSNNDRVQKNTSGRKDKRRRLTDSGIHHNFLK